VLRYYRDQAHLYVQYERRGPELLLSFADIADEMKCERRLRGMQGYGETGAELLYGIHNGSHCHTGPSHGPDNTDICKALTICGRGLICA